MENNKVMLLFQLISSLEDNFNSIQKAYTSNDKEVFDKSKKAILDISNKIGIVIR